ncbi:MAG TPA: ketopantoate reductase family protein [Candidatus Cloacimonetes bacterium]|nr:ketopantoate reductase family protein [Candidatus Cloacimonadota bacterium]
MNSNNHRYIIFGAGAVGSTAGGLLALNKKNAVLIGRKEHVQKINKDGLELNSYKDSCKVEIASFCSLADIQTQKNDVIILTVKSQDTPNSLKEIGKHYPKETPFISLQNSVLNEPEIVKYFPNCYGGVFRMTTHLLESGIVNFRKVGRIILGKYPKGRDKFIENVADDLKDSGFDVSVSEDIMNDKWLKLALNVTSVATGMFSNPQIDRNLTNQVKIKLLEEIEIVLKSAKIDATPCSSKDKTIQQMIEHFKKTAAPYKPKIPVYNSTWQDLQKSKPLEADYFLGVIIEIAHKNKIRIPVHEKIMEMCNFLEKNKLNQEYFQQKDIETILNQ